MDTIAAIATGNQIAAIGIIRVSGSEALPAADRIFHPADGKPLSSHPHRVMVLGTLSDREGNTLDQALAVTFAAGHSYTGEDSVEFHCHGSPVVLREILSALFALGVRQAKGGEFTKRAFLNGGLDLTQAEAVIDLIEAESPAAARNAAAQLGGSLRRLAEAVYEELLSLTSRFYAVVDYPDEDIEDVGREALSEALASSRDRLRRLASTTQRGRTLRAGVPTAIIGRPNAGKSSLLNALLGYDRAIVSEAPGTTRDTVEEKAVVGGVLLRLIDTAGLREASDTVERLGVERTRKAADTAGLVLAVVDGSRPMAEEDYAALEQAARREPWVLVWSKNDLPGEPVPFLRFTDGSFPPAATVSLSSVTGKGLPELEDAIARIFPQGDNLGEILTNPRQEDAVCRAAAALERSREALDSGLTPDAVIADMEEALSALGELTGKTPREDMVERIFSRFCVGK